VAGVRLISLQKGPGSEQIRQVPFPVEDLASRLDETAGAFVDTAAVMKNLDLVITSDTSIAHLAGALGVPVWVALSHIPDWRWLLEREDSPWYPTMRLFRQTTPGDWPGVFGRIAEAIRQRVPAGRVIRSIEVDVAPGELIDKITILEIKSTRMQDAAKLRHVQTELQALQAARQQWLPGSEALNSLTDQLREVNEALWVIEDDIRACEARKDFGPVFIGLARAVYQQNDRRAALKRQISTLLGSDIVEQKAYTTYQ
jgi:hypothetical protein